MRLSVTYNFYQTLKYLFFRRASGIRTHDPLHPMQVRYQTALLPEKEG